MTITPETKNSVTLTSPEKSTDLTWDDATYTWDDSSPDTWENQSVPLSKQTKNSVSLSNQTKNA